MQFLKAVLFTILLLLPSASQAQDWPQFLGPNADAKSSDTVPVEWDKAKNMLWTFELPGGGSSSPIIIGDKVFVTCFEQNGSKVTRYVVCVNKKSGEEIWSKEIEADYNEDGFNGYLREHGYASNTPVSDGKSLFVFLGKGGVYAFDLDGNQKWHKEVGKKSSSRRWGSAASLVLSEDSVIVNGAEEALSIFSFDKETGEEKWRSPTPELAFGTPRLAKTSGGRTELLLSVPGELWSMNPASGKLYYLVTTQLTGNVSPSVIVDDQRVYTFGGYRSKGSVAVKIGGKRDATKTNKVWDSRVTSYVATPLLHNEVFYWIDDYGIAHSASAKDGKEIYKERISGLSGRPVYASPVMIGEHIYVVTRRAGTIVYKPGNKFEPVARNVIAGDKTDFNASPAVSENRLFIRSDKALYCIGE